MNSKIKKGINIWSFPVGMSIVDSMKLAKKAGFEGIELALAAKGFLSMESDDEEIIGYKKAADEIGIVINSLATGLYWQFSLTSDREDIREKAKAVVKKQLDFAALLGADTALVISGSVGCDFKPEEIVPDAKDIEFYVGAEVIDYDIAWERAISAFKELAPYAQAKGVYIGIEMVWNKFLLSPLEMRNFIDEVGSPWVQAFLDTGNMVIFGYPQQWIKILGKRIKKVHLKDFRRSTPTKDAFVDLLAGDVDWDKVLEAFEQIGYEGWVNAEMCPTYRFYTDQMVYNTSASIDRILRRK